MNNIYHCCLVSDLLQLLLYWGLMLGSELYLWSLLWGLVFVMIWILLQKHKQTNYISCGCNPPGLHCTISISNRIIMHYFREYKSTTSEYLTFSFYTGRIDAKICKVWTVGGNGLYQSVSHILSFRNRVYIIENKYRFHNDRSLSANIKKVIIRKRIQSNCQFPWLYYKQNKKMTATTWSLWFLCDWNGIQTAQNKLYPAEMGKCAVSSISLEKASHRSTQ